MSNENTNLEITVEKELPYKGIVITEIEHGEKKNYFSEDDKTMKVITEKLMIPKLSKEDYKNH
jgi:hypothetical protein